jgi:hypothetical protein
MMSENIQQIEDLVGEEISGICFVRDYVELHFDGPVLRILTRFCLITPETMLLN